MFTKMQILESKKYRQYKDVLAVILSDEKTYTHEEIQQNLNDFLSTPIKEKINKEE